MVGEKESPEPGTKIGRVAGPLVRSRLTRGDEANVRGIASVLGERKKEEGSSRATRGKLLREKTDKNQMGSKPEAKAKPDGMGRGRKKRRRGTVESER